MSAAEEPIHLELSSHVAASADDVWKRISSFAGVNQELGPWLRMTSPQGAIIDVEAVPIGERWFRSRLLLLGLLPVDYDDLTFVSITPGRGFHERSTMRSMRVWEHERTLEPAGTGTIVRDRLAFVPRVRFATGMQRALVAWTFRRRQRRLAAYFSEE